MDVVLVCMPFAEIQRPSIALGLLHASLANTGLSSEVVRRQPDGTWLFVLDNPYTPER